VLTNDPYPNAKVITCEDVDDEKANYINLITYSFANDNVYGPNEELLEELQKQAKHHPEKLYTLGETIRVAATNYTLTEKIVPRKK
jgi:hypothetical protein